MMVSVATFIWLISVFSTPSIDTEKDLNSAIAEAYASEDYNTVVSLVEDDAIEHLLPQLNDQSIEQLGISYFNLKKYEKAIGFAKNHLIISTKSSNFLNAYVDCYYIATSHEYLLEMDSASKYSSKGLDFAYKTGSKINISRALHNHATLQEKQHKYPEALLSYQMSIDAISTDSTELMQTRSNISNVYYKIGILDSAFKIASETYQYFNKIQTDEYWKWLSTYRLAYIEEDYKNELARSYYHELLSISDNDYDRALAELGLSESYLKKQNDSAFYFYSVAKQKATKDGNKMLIREVNFIKARLFLALQPNQEKLKEALETLRNILDTQKSIRAEAAFRILESKFYLNENDFEKSMISANVAVENARRFNHKDRLSEALTQKFKVLNYFGRYQEALAVKEEEIKVQQELFNDRSEAVYQILRTQNEMDKQESTIANQQLVIDNNNLQITIMYITIALVVIALGFIFLQYRTRSKYASKLETMFLDSRHRYMNNLLLLKNWFNEGKTENNDEIISFAQNRIDAISTVNRHLDRLSYNKNTIASRSFLEDISHNLLANRQFTSEIEDLPINMSVSGPLGMITNEIITNGLKYGKEPYAIRFHKNGSGYILEIEDNGPGIENPEKQGTGSKVLRLLSKQLKGELRYQNKADLTPEIHGTRVTLTFKG